MANKTKIEWVKNSQGEAGNTWNPLRGCSRVSEGCRNCYAEGMAARFCGAGQPYEGTINPETRRWNGKVRLVPEKLEEPLRWQRPRMVFVNSMSDLFHEEVPFEFIDKVFAVMALSRQHTFQVLTKRPARMLKYFESFHAPGAEARGFNVCAWASEQFGIGIPGTIAIGQTPNGLPNVWIGVTVENQDAANERIPLLLKTPAAVRWVSMEPLLGPVDLTALPSLSGIGRNLDSLDDSAWCKDSDVPTRIDWVVVGGESGSNARPMHPDWARSLRDQCAAAGVPFLFKQWGEWADLTNDENGSALHQKATGDNIFTSTGQVLGAGYKSRYGCGGMVEENWREKGGAWMGKVGKKSAGRLLDGVQHDGYPINHAY